MCCCCIEVDEKLNSRSQLIFVVVVCVPNPTTTNNIFVHYFYKFSIDDMCMKIKLDQEPHACQSCDVGSDPGETNVAII